MATYKKRQYLLMSTDPIHIGTGGYRLGRVDLSIVREPGTRIPKIPGTSLSGAVRSYAASQYESPDCAGQKDHCAKEGCPICYTFGYLQESEGQTRAYSGVVNIFDARVLLFPVYSMAGPVWVSTPARLQHAGFAIEGLPQGWPSEQALLAWERQDALNLGWMMLETGAQVTIEAPANWKCAEEWQAIAKRIVLVQEPLFSQVVNSNLEVRTSVSINPNTGAAEEGALYTYEALPRATFLVSEVVLDQYRDGKFPVESTKTGVKLPGGKPWKGPLDVVDAGLRLMGWLGVGGMGTRGFGRLAVVGAPAEEAWQ